MTKKPYVYVLSDQGTPFYVGVGIDDRMFHHEQFARGQRDLGYGLKDDYNPHKTRKIQKLIQEGRSIEYSYTEYDTKEQALKSEKDLIKKYGRATDGGILTNITEGGTGGDTYTGLSEEQKINVNKKIKESVRAVYDDPIKGAIIREKIRATKEANGTIKHTITEAHRANCRHNAIKQRKAVLQCDDQGNVIKVWSSMKEASEALSLSQGAISNSIRGKTKTGQPWKAGGFIWKF